jgi:Cu/Ag efflux pump CusA
VFGIVVMNRTLHTKDVIPRVKAEIEKLNSDGSLPRGVKIVPFYDRSTLVNVTTATGNFDRLGCPGRFFRHNTHRKREFIPA